MLDLLPAIADFVLRIDDHLAAIAADFGSWIYAVLFLLVIAETGLIATPLLPGNTLLFATGALCALPGTGLNVHLAASLLWAGAVLGNSFNYWLGTRLGPPLFRREDAVIVRRRHLDRAHAFFDSHGGRVLVLSRFVPVARTYMPFAAGVLHLPPRRFLAGNVAGGFIWCFSLIYAGYAVGGLPAVQRHFDAVILSLVVLSVLPLGWAAWRVWNAVRRERSAIP